MNKRFKVAKNQGLHWQVLLLEEVQSRLKVLIRDEVLRKKNFNQVEKVVVAFVKKEIEDLAGTQLYDIAFSALMRFGTRIYIYFDKTFNKLDFVVIGAMVAVSYNKATLEQKNIVKTAFEKSKVETAIIPKIGAKTYEVGVPLEMYAKDYMKLVELRINQIAEIEAKDDYSSRVSLRNVAEMQVREDAHKNELNELINSGVDLVWIVPHANASKRCEKWQGKLYSISGKSGTIDGISYQPLSNATEVYETTNRGIIYKNGCISGFNCRHKLQPYTDKNIPVEIPANVVEKQRKINNRQRYLERGVRIWKERALLFKDIDKEKYLYSRAKAKNWNETYIEYSKENNVAYYPSRTDII